MGQLASGDSVSLVGDEEPVLDFFTGDDDSSELDPPATLAHFLFSELIFRGDFSLLPDIMITAMFVLNNWKNETKSNES